MPSKITPSRLQVKISTLIVILWIQIPTAFAANPIYAYLDNISPGWSNWSWETTYADDTTIKKTGTASAHVQINSAWGGFSLNESPASNPVAGLSAISFDINPGAADNIPKVASLQLSLQHGDNLGTPLAIDTFASPPLGANVWSKISVPIGNLAGNLTNIDRINLQDGLGQGNVTFHVDNIGLIPSKLAILTKTIRYNTGHGVMTAQVTFPAELTAGDKRPVIVMVPGWNGSGDVAATVRDFWSRYGYITLSIGFKDLGNWNSNIQESAAGALDALFTDAGIPASKEAIAIDGQSYGGTQAVLIAQSLKTRFKIKAVLTQDAGYTWPGTCTSSDNGATCPSNPNANLIGLNMAVSSYSVAMIQNKDDKTFPIDSCDDNNCGARNRANYHAIETRVYSNCSGTGGHGARGATWRTWTINAMKRMLHHDQNVPIFPGYERPSADIGNACRNILHTQERFLTDYEGKPVMLRGVNFGGYWAYDVNNPSIALSMVDEIAKTGANSMRLVWQGNREFNRDPSVLDKLMSRVTANRMIVIPELHNSADGAPMTCSSLASGTVGKATRYWTSPEVMAVLKKYEGKIVLNIANEVGSPDDDLNTQTQALINAYRPAILAIRKAGLRSPLMIDAPFCGQDGLLLARAANSLLLADPLHNIIFSVHAYWSERNYIPRINRLVSAFGKKAFVFGEFSSALDCSMNATASNYQNILSMSNTHKIGYLAWNWGGIPSFDTDGNACPIDGRGAGYARQDMTDIGGTFAKLAGWGLDIANNIRLTSIKPGIF